VQKLFRYLEPFRRDLRVWRTDRRTDIIIENAAFNQTLWYLCGQKAGRWRLQPVFEKTCVTTQKNVKSQFFYLKT